MATLTLISAALALFSTVSNPPFDRAQALIQGADGIETDIKVTVEGKATGSGHYWFKKPSKQRLRLDSPNDNEEFFANKIATIAFNHSEKAYAWYPSFTGVVDVPPESGILMEYGQPNILSHGGLSSIAKKESWKEVGKESIRGSVTTILVAAPTGVKPEDSPYKVWIDGSGRILKTRVKIITNYQVIFITSEFSNMKFQPIPDSFFDFAIPDGYMPTRPPKLHDTLGAGDQAVLGSAYKYPSGEKVDLTNGKPKQPVVVLFLSNDLTPEKQEDWAKVAELVQKGGVRFIQVWLGSKPTVSAPSWETYWDKDGEIEKQLGIPVTPYVIGMRGGGIVGGWQGVLDQTPEAVTKLLLDPLKAGTTPPKRARQG